jgi:iron complex outermembrane recepter protein
VTMNVPSAEVTGIEANVSIRPVHWLELGASGAYTDARYTGDMASLFGTTYIFGPYADTPKTTMTLYGRVVLPSPEQSGPMSVSLEGYGQSSQYFSNAADSLTPNTKLPGYVLANGRYSWDEIMGTHLSARLFVKNMFNKGYFVGGLSQGASLGLNAADVGEPRMFGLEATYKF